MIRVFLVLACAFWLLIVVELLPGLAWGGLEGVRDRLLHIWSGGRLEVSWTCLDSLRLLHEGYTDMILFLLLTWAAVELKRFLHRRMQEQSRRSQIPAVSH